ncbi:hypothetical protein FNV43_RR24763 [Rhamnella rubrinervis]|uniref:Uncharacterized protein n=1 Tax=Rhamnella rubrinervis TaxID=2594499 RepID=A0A8K0GTH3_9ROSA|nr:hypothetical protein FNV43_RR24763 [Rhamnella rubrinervis]
MKRHRHMERCHVDILDAFLGVVPPGSLYFKLSRNQKSPMLGWLHDFGSSRQGKLILGEISLNLRSFHLEEVCPQPRESLTCGRKSLIQEKLDLRMKVLDQERAQPGEFFDLGKARLREDVPRPRDDSTWRGRSLTQGGLDPGRRFLDLGRCTEGSQSQIGRRSFCGARKSQGECTIPSWLQFSKKVHPHLECVDVVDGVFVASVDRNIGHFDIRWEGCCHDLLAEGAARCPGTYLPFLGPPPSSVPADNPTDMAGRRLIGRCRVDIPDAFVGVVDNIST